MKVQSDPARQPVAQVGRQLIYEEDLMPKIGAQLTRLRNQEYELKLKALSTLIKSRLIEERAKSAGLDKEVFFERTVDIGVAPPPETEIEAYYLARKHAANQSLDEAREQIRTVLAEMKRRQARLDYMDRLLENAGVTILLKRPRVGVDLDPSRLRGGRNAPVTIVEFADFQCPYCRDAEQVLSVLINKYKDKIRVAYQDFPLKQIHNHAEKAAEASRCAAEQGRFWEYHDLLYAQQEYLDPNGLREQARKTGLDVEEFNACLTGGKFASAVERDFQAGLKSGVSSTPTFFVNGIVIAGLEPASSFEKVIDCELAEAP